jgi:outer membrane protein OmpA-like peptidoglycan-associated protein
MQAPFRRFAALGLVTSTLWVGSPPRATAQWTVSMRAMQNPLPVGQCTGIEVTVMDERGYAPVRPDQKQASGWDFDFEFVAAAPDAFAWRDERHRFLCAKAPTAAIATVLAHYPARHLKPVEQVPGLILDRSIDVQMQGVPMGQPSSVASTTVPGPSGGMPPAAGNAAGVAPTAPAGAASGYPAPAASGPTYGAGSIQPTGQAASATPALGSAGEAQPAVKSPGGLLKTIGAHAKQKAGEVTDQTAQTIAGGAADVIDTTLETGGGVVSSAALEASNTARSSIGSVGRSLTPVAFRGGETSDNLATAMAAGGAELRMVRFTGTTDVLQPASRDLVKRLAAALNATPGNFVIEAHVDPLPSPAASQELSEHRAAAARASPSRRCRPAAVHRAVRGS